MTDLQRVAAALVARPRGILAADESPGTMDQRLEGQGIPASEEARRAYREMSVDYSDLSDGVSGCPLRDVEPDDGRRTLIPRGVDGAGSGPRRQG